MVAALERERAAAACRVAGELECELDGLGSGRGQEHAVEAVRRAMDEQPAAELRSPRVDEVVALRELGDLRLDRGHHLGVGMADRGDQDRRREVEEDVAVDVLDVDALGAPPGDRRLARRRRALLLGGLRDQTPALGSGHVVGDDAAPRRGERAGIG